MAAAAAAATAAAAAATAAAAAALVSSEGNGACVVHGYNVGQRLSAGAPCARSATHVLLLLL